MISSLIRKAHQICCIEGATKLLLVLITLPAVVLGTLVAAVVAPIVAFWVSALAALRAIGTLNKSPVLDLPASFTAGAVNQFSV